MARLPVIRISSDGYRTMPKPSGAVRNISVAKIREEREFVENALRATVEAVAGSVLSSKWYLEQLHYFIKLEASRIRERGLNQARDIEELADELWQLASGRIQDLEEVHSRELQGLNQELEQYKAIAEHFSDGQEEWREADEALAMAKFPGRAIDLLLEGLTHSFKATVLDTSLHVPPFDFEFRESEERKISRWELIVTPTWPLKSVGYEARTFVSPPIHIKLVNDYLGIGQNVLEKFPKAYLLFSEAIPDLEADQKKLVNLIKQSLPELHAEMRARYWKGRPFDSICEQMRSMLASSAESERKMPSLEELEALRDRAKVPA